MVFELESEPRWGLRTAAVERQKREAGRRNDRPHLFEVALPQVRGGKTPCNAILKFNVRYGIMLLCGRLPPEGPIMLKFIAARFAGGVYALPPLDRARTAAGSGIPALAGGGAPLHATK